MDNTMEEEPNQDRYDPLVVQNQYTRLGFFLTASAFLIVAFITLITSEKEVSEWLTHMVAGLGCVIAQLYLFMNLWESLHQPGSYQLIHLWLIPFVIFLFWLIGWRVYVESNLVLIIMVLFPILYIYQRYRGRFEKKFQRQIKWFRKHFVE